MKLTEAPILVWHSSSLLPEVYCKVSVRLFCWKVPHLSSHDCHKINYKGSNGVHIDIKQGDWHLVSNQVGKNKNRISTYAQLGLQPAKG